MLTASFMNSLCNTLYCCFNFTIYIHPSQNIELPESSVLKAYKCNFGVYMYNTVVMHIAVAMMQTISVSLTYILYLYNCHFFNRLACVNCSFKDDDLENYTNELIF